MRRLYRLASVEISNWRQLDLAGGESLFMRRPTEKQAKALQIIWNGGRVDAATEWTLIRDGHLRPSHQAIPS